MSTVGTVSTMVTVSTVGTVTTVGTVRTYYIRVSNYTVCGIASPCV